MEEWKKTSYEGYEVSNLGNVRNTKTGKVLKNSLSSSNDYYKVTLTIGCKGSRKPFPIEVHRLVAEAFVPKPFSTEPLVVDHIKENDKLNNEASNLQWLTQSQNLRKANTKRNRTFFSEIQKQEIRKAYMSGDYSLIKLTKYFNDLYSLSVSRQTYTRIVKGTK